MHESRKSCEKTQLIKIIFYKVFMSKPGPKPKPTAIRELEGNAGNLPYNTHEPKPKSADSLNYVDWMDDDCEYMTGDGKFLLSEVSKKIWDEMAPQLELLGVLKSVDTAKFARYCEAFARWLKMKAFIDKNGETYPIYGMIYETDDNNPDAAAKCRKVLKQIKVFPQATFYLKLSEVLRKYEEEFGIGAASRTRISTVVQVGSVLDDEHDFDYAKKDRHLSAVPRVA